jgi:4-hydroxy-3-polyprenylbenzoate decarboxylase
MNHGSKMVLDLTGPERERAPLGALPDLAARYPEVLEQALVEEAALLVRARAAGGRGARTLVEKLVADPDLERIPLVVALSADVDLADRVSWLWGWFTRFDPASDLLFRRSTLRGAVPVHEGPMGIDATWKEGYPRPLEMPDEVVRRVSARWREYGFGPPRR